MLDIVDRGMNFLSVHLVDTQKHTTYKFFCCESGLKELKFYPHTVMSDKN